MRLNLLESNLQSFIKCCLLRTKIQREFFLYVNKAVMLFSVCAVVPERRYYAMDGCTVSMLELSVCL